MSPPPATWAEAVKGQKPPASNHPPPLLLPASFSYTRIAWRGVRGRDWFSRRRMEKKNYTSHAEPEQQLLDTSTGRAIYAQRMRGRANVRGGGGENGWREGKQPEELAPEQPEPESEQPEPEQAERVRYRQRQQQRKKQQRKRRQPPPQLQLMQSQLQLMQPQKQPLQPGEEVERRPQQVRRQQPCEAAPR